jgi:hypothetical protein
MVELQSWTQLPMQALQQAQDKLTFAVPSMLVFPCNPL